MKKTTRLVLLVAAGSMALLSGLQAQPGKAKRKATPDLVQLAAKVLAPLPAATDGPLVQEDLSLVIDGRVAIDAVAKDGDGAGLLASLSALGLVQGSYAGRMVSGFLPAAQVAALEAVAGLQFAQPAYMPLRSVGVTTSQADVSLRADVARATYGVTGAGSKVGILSDSYNALGGAAAGVASGDLPAGVQVLADLLGPPLNSDEGRGMAELVHDVAPGAELAFHTAFAGQANFANGIRALAAAGCNIIVDDVIYFAEPFFQDGIIAQAVDEVVKNKVTYFSSAGNNANTSYESAFRNSGVVVPGFGEAHDFGGGDIRQTFTLSPRGSLRIALQWDDPFFSVSGGAGAQTDLDFLVYLNNRLTFSSATDNLGGDPVEFLSLNSSSPNPISVEIVITKYAGPDPKFIKWVHYGNGNVPAFIEYNTGSSTVIGHANAKGAIAVGAAAFFNTPAYNPALSTAVINGFSSKGGTPVFIKDDGKKTGMDEGKRRAKPEITATDGTNTSFFGRDIAQDADAFPNFFGTSAAAPHAAAVAALMQEVRGDKIMSPAAVLDMMVQSAIDMDDPETAGFDAGFDFRTGAGYIQADRCVQLAGGSPTARVAAYGVPAALVMRAFPNPTSGSLSIEIPGTEPADVTVFDARGALVFKALRTPGGSRATVDLAAQPAGMYLVRMAQQGAVQTAKVMVSR